MFYKVMRNVKFVKSLSCLNAANCSADKYQKKYQANSDICTMSIRQEKFGKVIQKELASIFLANRSELFHNAFITVSKVEVSPDLGFAKVFLSFLQAPDPHQLLQTIEGQKKHLRHELALKIRKQVRIIPELHFVLDDSLDYVFKMEKIFEELHKKEKP
jgi:ribosome-binding factor A